MNVATDTLNKVKTLLGLEVSLEQMKLDNGTVIEAEKFEAGESVFIITEDEKVALPIGEYELEDGSKLVVEEEGIVATIGAAEEEVVEEEVIEEEVEAEDQETEMEYVSKREFTEAMTEIVKMIEDIKNKEVEASDDTSGSLKSRTVKEEFEEQEIDELQTQLTEAAVKPLKHAPKEESTYKAKFNFNKNKQQTPYDRIVAKISNIKN
tara:strand:- start:1915 stop:2538 length:624 start_codon:yes stop_codon:yes gene_type:complete